MLVTWKGEGVQLGAGSWELGPVPTTATDLDRDCDSGLYSAKHAS